jgi:hypothetical protein
MLKAQVAFLDEIKQLHACWQGIAASDADDEAKVGSDEPVLGCSGATIGTLEVDALFAIGEAGSGGDALFDDLGQLTLFCSSE